LKTYLTRKLLFSLILAMVLIFLTNFLRNSEQSADINELEPTPVAAGRTLFDENLGVAAADLTHGEIECLRPLLYEQLAAQSAKLLFLKIHDAFTYNANGVPLFPKQATGGVIYFIRNPLDVAVSFAHHLGADLASTVQRLNDPTYGLALNSKRLHEQLPQRLLSWGDHVGSWIDESGLPVQVMRYEDMVLDSLATFRAAIRFVGLPDDLPRIEKALAFSTFDQVQKQEQANGFRERTIYTPAFFRKGSIGDWRNVLQPEQVTRVIEAHRAVMRRFGYLTAADELVF
jgi:hypothetical protein